MIHAGDLRTPEDGLVVETRLVACMAHRGKDLGRPDPGCKRCLNVTRIVARLRLGNLFAQGEGDRRER